MAKQGQWETISDAGDPFKKKMRIAANGNLEVEYDQKNMGEVLEVNRELQREGKASSSLWNGRETVHVARIPEELIHKWMREGINFYRGNEDDRARLMQKLNDPDYAHLRVDDPGRRL